MSLKRVTNKGPVEALFGFLRRPGASPHSLEEIDEAIARVIVEDDKRIRQGERDV